MQVSMVFPGRDPCSVPKGDSSHAYNSRGAISLEKTSSASFILPLAMLPKAESVPTQIKTTERSQQKCVPDVTLPHTYFLWKDEILATNSKMKTF